MHDTNSTIGIRMDRFGPVHISDVLSEVLPRYIVLRTPETKRKNVRRHELMGRRRTDSDDNLADSGNCSPH